MLIFNAARFIDMSSRLTTLAMAINTSIQILGGKFFVSVTDFVTIKNSTEELRDKCKEIGLGLTSITAEHVIDVLAKVEARGSQVVRNDQGFVFDLQDKEEMRLRLHELSERIKDELSIPLFLNLSPSEAAYFSLSKFPFGDLVANKMPGAVEDVSEASKCIGLGRFTASVFHLMRAIEIAVQKFGDKLGITLLDSRGRTKMWQSILDEVNKVVRALNQNDPLTKQYAAISSLLHNVKLAWRNEVMHPKDTYTEEEAKNVFDATKAFMNELASVL